MYPLAYMGMYVSVLKQQSHTTANQLCIGMVTGNMISLSNYLYYKQYLCIMYILQLSNHFAEKVSSNC